MSEFSVLSPIILSPFFFKSSVLILVSPPSTGIPPIIGSPSIRGTISSGFIPLNSSTASHSICAIIFLLDNILLAWISYWISFPSPPAVIVLVTSVFNN